MKKSIIILSLLSFANMAFSQTFSHKFDYFPGFISFVETYDNNYAFFYNDSLLILDNSGNIIQNFKIQEDSCQINNVFKIPDNKYLSIGFNEMNEGSNYSFWFRKYDENFNVIYENTENVEYINSRILRTFDCTLNKHHEPVIIADKWAVDYNSYDTTFIYSFSNDCKLKFDTSYTDYFQLDRSNIIAKPDSSGYIICSSYMGGYTEIYNLDNNFNITDTVNIASTPLNKYFSPNYFMFINDSTFVLAAQTTEDFLTDYRPVGVLKGKLNSEVLIETKISRPNTDNRMNWSKGLDFVDSNYIYTCYNQSKNLDSFFPLLTVVAQLDNNLNIKWEKFYGDSINLFEATRIHATTDKGAVILGKEYDYKGFLFNFILKIDSLGNNQEMYTNTQHHIKTSELILYPNPGNDILQLRTAVQQTGGIFYMYDIAGKEIFSQQINSTLTQINTADLPSGAYIFKYINKNSVIESGKWIKN